MKVDDHKTENSLIKAGKICSLVLDELKDLIFPGNSVIEICQYADDRITELGGEKAFPCHVLMDDIANNYTSPMGDKTMILENKMVSVDLGVHIEGNIAMSARTFLFDPLYKEMKEAISEGMKSAIQSMCPGASSKNVNNNIELIIKPRGFKTLNNLVSHRIGKYKLSENTFSINDSATANEGESYALFIGITDILADGMVTSGPPSNIFLFQKNKFFINTKTRKMLNYIENEHRTLPFASRWIFNKFPKPEGKKAFQELQKTNCISTFPQLIERTNMPVAIAQQTVIITKEGCKVIT